MTNQQPARSPHTSPSQPPPPRPGQPSTYPTQGQHPAPAHSRPAPEDSRGTPAPRREGRETAAPKPRDSTQERERTQDRERTAASACTQGSQHSNQGQHEDRGRPSRPQPMQSPSQPDSRASAAQEMEGRGQRDGREEGKERNGQKMTVKERRPACTPDRASAQALRPYCQQSQHTRTEDSPGERQRIGESIPLLWSMQNCP